MPQRCLRARPLVGALVVLAALAAPAGALADTPLTGVPTTTTTSTAQTLTTATVTTATATPVATATTGGGGLNTIETVGIGVAVLALFGSIAYVIRSDARAHAPTRGSTIDIDRERATVRPRAERIKRSRARARAARRARRAGR